MYTFLTAWGSALKLCHAGSNYVLFSPVTLVEPPAQFTESINLTVSIKTISGVCASVAGFLLQWVHLKETFPKRHLGM